MRIKICQENRSKIDAVFVNINGKSCAHTADDQDVIVLATAMELQMNALQIAKKDRAGATATSMSGSNVPTAYKYSRIVNGFRIERGSSDWFLVAVSRHDVWGNAEKSRLSLTPAQRDIAIAKFSAQFSVLQVVVLAVAA
jgi:hypothetical protein